MRTEILEATRTTETEMTLARQIGEIVTLYTVPYGADEPSATTVFRPAVDPYMANLPA